MAIKFITGNVHKFEEVQSLLGVPLERVHIDLPEVQGIDAEAIVREKLLAAEQHALGEYIVEDTSLYLSCLDNKLPGPLVKWFETALGNEGIVTLTEKYDNVVATATTLVGYIGTDKEVHIFEGHVSGAIVRPRGGNDFGWGPIFQPDGHTQTFGEMTKVEKASVSMRALAVRRLRDFLHI